MGEKYFGLHLRLGDPPIGSRGLDPHLVERLLTGLGDNGEIEQDSYEGDPTVRPERAIEAKHFREVDESFDPKEGAEVAEGGGDGGSKRSELQREDLAKEEPGDRGDPGGEGKLKEQHADEGDVVEAALHPVRVRLGYVVVEREDPKAGQGESHNKT